MPLKCRGPVRHLSASVTSTGVFFWFFVLVTFQIFFYRLASLFVCVCVCVCVCVGVVSHSFWSLIKNGVVGRRVSSYCKIEMGIFTKNVKM